MDKIEIKYYGKFSNEIPETFSSLINKRHHKILFDPFCGSGTTFFSMHNKFDSIILNDINSVAIRYLNNKKNLSKINFKKFTIKFKNFISDSNKNVPSGDHPNIFELEKWFSKKNLDQLLKIWNSSFYFNNYEYEYLLLITTSFLKKIVNKRKIWNVGYISDNVIPNIENDKDIFKLIIFHFAFFKKKLTHIQKDNELKKMKITKIDLTKSKINFKYDFIITSPPYPFAVDYTRNLRLEYLFLNENLEKDFISEIGARGKRSPVSAVDDFFVNMEIMYLKIMDSLSIGGIFCMSIANTKRKGQEINFIQWTIDLFLSNGFELIFKKTRELKQQATPNKKINYEKLLAFEKK